MASIFSKIVAGEIPCHKVHESDEYLAFLDINPLQLGHVLVIPKREVDYIYDLEESELAGLMIFSKRVSKAIEKTFPCNRIGIAVIGLEVPHAHMHLIPINALADMDFTRTKLSVSHQKLAEIAKKINSNL